MTLSSQEKIESYKENIAESLRILDEIIDDLRDERKEKKMTDNAPN